MKQNIFIPFFFFLLLMALIILIATQLKDAQRRIALLEQKVEQLK